VRAIDRLRDAYGQLTDETVIEQLAICLFARGHALLMGVPGLAKTLLVSKLAETLSLDFSRIQFTPDLMPMDITGTDILQDTRQGRRELEFVKGPIFANIVLADEINRAPPKTQAALLEAMQEYRVTALGKTFELTAPFLVLATQNPVEQEGTYPLPEAQLDRFMFLIEVDYPTEAEEIEITRTTTGAALATLAKLMAAEEIIQHQELVRRIPVDTTDSTDASAGDDGSRMVTEVCVMGRWAACCSEPDPGSESACGAEGQLHGASGRCAGGDGTGADASHHHNVRRTSGRHDSQADRGSIGGRNRRDRSIILVRSGDAKWWLVTNVFGPGGSDETVGGSLAVAFGHARDCLGTPSKPASWFERRVRRIPEVRSW
jgi:hypothetical protein